MRPSAYGHGTKSGGLDHVAYWLRQRDVSAFAPGERPLMTDAKAVMLEGGLSPGEALLAQAMRDRVGPFRPGAVMGPWQPLVDALQEQQQQHKISIQSLYVAAQHAGWLDLGKIRTKAEHSVKKHILCSPETLEKYQAQPQRDPQNARNARADQGHGARAAARGVKKAPGRGLNRGQNGLSPEETDESTECVDAWIIGPAAGPAAGQSELPAGRRSRLELQRSRQGRIAPGTAGSAHGGVFCCVP
jgi:hypothetical protein